MRLRKKIIVLLALCLGVLLANTWVNRELAREHLQELELIRSELYPASYLMIEVEHLLLLRLKNYEDALLFDDVSLLKSSARDKDVLMDFLFRAREKLAAEEEVLKELSIIEHHMKKALTGVGPMYEKYMANQLDSELQKKVLEQGRHFDALKEKIKDIKWRTQQLLDMRLGEAATHFKRTSEWLRSFEYFIVILFILTSLRVYKTGAVRVSQLAESTRNLTENMDQAIEIDDRKDEITELAKSLESMRISVLEKQQGMEEKRLQAEDALRVKGDFLSNMSHELRTPLNAILGMTGVLSQYKDEGERGQEYVSCIESIKRAGTHLLELINDVLDLSKLEAGKVVLKEEPLSLKMIMEDLLVFFKGMAEKRENRLVLDIDDKLPSYMVSDAVILRQILTNLVGNAIKFTYDGTVTMGAKMVGNDKILISVKDTGMGISPSNLSIIFDQFKQVEDAHTKNTGGTGLGLAICKQLTKLLGGEISVDSREGEGSVFRVKFKPAKIILDEPEKMSCELGPLDMSILVMEDNEDNILLLKMYFKKLSHRVKYFENGELGLDEFKSNSQDYDLVISDMQMPVMDGYTAVFEMRKFEESQGLPRKRIVALTAFAAGEDQKKSLDAGCDHVYHKPISKQDFKALLNAEASKVSQQES